MCFFLKSELHAAPTSAAHQSPSPLSPFTLVLASPPHCSSLFHKGRGRKGGKGGRRNPKGGIAAFQRRGRSCSDHRVMRAIKEKATLIFFFPLLFHFHHREIVKTGGPTDILLKETAAAQRTNTSSSRLQPPDWMTAADWIEVPRLGAHVPHVEVDHVLCVGPLHGDGEGFEGVEGEGHQAPHRVVDGPPQQARLDLKLEQA